MHVIAESEQPFQLNSFKAVISVATVCHAWIKVTILAFDHFRVTCRGFIRLTICLLHVKKIECLKERTLYQLHNVENVAQIQFMSNPAFKGQSLIGKLYRVHFVLYLKCITLNLKIENTTNSKKKPSHWIKRTQRIVYIWPKNGLKQPSTLG